MPKLRETIKTQLAKGNLFIGNVETELDSWLDLIEKMISLDYNSRISAKEALNNSFFKESPLACEPREVLPEEIRNPAPDTDYHEFITKNEKNKKINFKKEYTFKHNKLDEAVFNGAPITDLITPGLI